MYNEKMQGFINPIETQEEFDTLVDCCMEKGDDEALFTLLEKYPDFMRQYAGELEKELGL